MWDDVSSELTIIARAQQTVDRWRLARNPEAFEIAIARASDQLWEYQPDMTAAREAFCQVAYAIRNGEGHAFRHREPLVRIAQRVLFE
jgi:hypothetical protein